MRRLLLPGLFLGLAATAVPASASVYTIDATHSSLVFKVRHMVVSTVSGTFNDVAGSITYAPDDPKASGVDVRIAAASIDTSNEKRDEHLRSADFFDAENHPEITFVSDRVERAGDEWLVHGVLTIRGVSKPLTIPFRVNGPITDPRGNLRMGIEAEPVTIDRKDFGVSWNRVLDTGGLTVGDEVQISIDLAAVHTPPEPAAS